MTVISAPENRVIICQPARTVLTVTARATLTLLPVLPSTMPALIQITAHPATARVLLRQKQPTISRHRQSVASVILIHLSAALLHPPLWAMYIPVLPRVAKAVTAIHICPLPMATLMLSRPQAIYRQIRTVMFAIQTVPSYHQFLPTPALPVTALHAMTAVRITPTSVPSA